MNGPIRSEARPRHRTEPLIAAAIAAAGTAAFTWFAASRGSAGIPLAATSLIFALFFIPYPALSVEPWSADLRDRLIRGRAWPCAIPWIVALVLYTGYAAAFSGGPPSMAALGRVALYGVLPIAFMAAGRRPDRTRGDVRGEAVRIRSGEAFRSPLSLVAAILALWLPVEFGALGGLPLPAGVPHAFEAARLLAFDLGLLLFVAAWPAPDLGFTFRFARRDLGFALVALAAYAAVAIPLGLRIGFLHYGVRTFVASQWTASLLNIYFFTAIPEELLFRGLIQNLLEKKFASRIGALLIAAVLFGASHLDNPPAPNVRYALLATLAGLAYGWVWMKTRKITASALTHAAVDIIWVLLLRG